MKYQNKPNDLQKFLDAQNSRFYLNYKYTMYEKALEEIRAANKIEHWIWYVFPNVEGLGHSSYSKLYGLPGVEGAIAYLSHSTLHDRYMEISEALVELDTDDLLTVMWEIDCLKVRSSITLFYLASVELFGSESKEAKLLIRIRDKFFGRIGFCEKTLEILQDN